MQEITSPTSNRYIYFVSFIIENWPSVECVDLQQARSWHADDVVQTPHVAFQFFFFFFFFEKLRLRLGRSDSLQLSHWHKFSVSGVYDRNHPYLVSERLFLAENKAFPYPRRAGPILWDAAATWPVVIFVAVARKQKPKTERVVVDRLPVSTGNFERALQRHFLVDFRNQDVAGKIFFCSKRACFCFVNRTRNGLTAPSGSLPTHRFRDWSKTEAALQRQRHCSVICQSIFKTKMSLERPFPALNENVWLLWIERETAEERPLEVCPTHRFRDWSKTEAALKFNLLTGYPKYERHALHWRHWLGENEVQKLKRFFFFFNVMKARKFACVV